jgi:ABC-type phosphate/phosphonate transport system substrate-binding protein
MEANSSPSSKSGALYPLQILVDVLRQAGIDFDPEGAPD